MRLASFACAATTALTLASGSAGAASNSHPLRVAIHSGAPIVRAFALTASQQLKGPAQRPFLGLLKTSPPAKQVGVTISTKATKNMQCSGGVCTPTGPVAALNVNDLARLLGDGSVTIATTAVTPDIFVNAPFSWVSANGLTLQAIGNIVVNKAVTDAGPAPLSLIYNANGGGGTLFFGAKGHISFFGIGNPLTINGQGYILANNIQTLAQLIARNPSGSFALSADYNAKQDGKYTHSPIQTVFQGNFEGLGNRVTGLHVKSEGGDQPVGFFGQTSPTAVIGNFNLAGTIVVAPAAYIGGTAGLNQGTIFQTVFNGTIVVSGGPCVVMRLGGIAGENDGIVSFSHATGGIDVSPLDCGTIHAGGLIGYDASAVDHSWAGVSLSIDDFANLNVGGLIGWMESDIVDQVYAVGSVTIDNESSISEAGGLVGGLNGSLSHASASGAVSAQGSQFTDVGGLVGDMNGIGNTVEDGVATGAVSGINCACGGAIGYGFQVHDSTSFGTVSGSLVGGFIGSDDTAGDLSNDGWCTTSSGITDPGRGAGNIPNDPGISPFTC